MLLNEAPVGVIPVVSSEIVIDQDDDNKKSISVELPEAVKNGGVRAGMELRRCARDGGPSEAGHSRIDAAIKGTRRLSGIEIWTFADDEQEVTVRLEFELSPITADVSDKPTSSTSEPTLAELVLQSFPNGPPPRQRLLPRFDIAPPISSPDLIETARDETPSADDGATPTEQTLPVFQMLEQRDPADRRPWFISAERSKFDREMGASAARSAEPRSAIDPNYRPYRQLYD